MPLIEELPITQTHRVTHGWAYVPDTGPNPIAAVQPGNRKRGRDGATAAATATATAKQQKAVQARLDSLNRENYRDGVPVPIPARAGGEKKRDKKMTSNVRRILTYQRAFAHYLADEEANLLAGTGTATQNQGQTAMAKQDGRRKATVTAAAPAATTAAAAITSTPATTMDTTPAPTPARRGRPPSAAKKRERELELQRQEKENMQPPPTPKPTTTPIKQEPSEPDINADTTMTDAPTLTPATTTTTTTTTPHSNPSHATLTTSLPPPSKPTYDPALDSHPLLRTTDLPKMPSARVMAALLAEPPLSYTSARAKIPVDNENEKPVRRFCAICGYWGKVKCRKCGEWTCGVLECWRGHEGVCPAAGQF